MRRSFFQIPGTLKLTANIALENGWLEYVLVSFWGKRPIFRGYQYVSRECLVVFPQPFSFPIVFWRNHCTTCDSFIGETACAILCRNRRNGPGFPAKLHHHLEGENSAGFAMGPSVVGSHCFTRSTLWPSHRNLLVCHHERPLACTHLIQKRQWIWQKHGKSSACETLFFVSSDYLHMSHGSIDFSKKMQVSHVLGRLDKNIGPNPCQSAIVKVQHSFLGELLHIPVVKIEGM